MSKETFRYTVTNLDLPTGHGFRKHYATDKSNAFILAHKLKMKNFTVKRIYVRSHTRKGKVVRSYRRRI
jgi:hypothetical protein